MQVTTLLLLAVLLLAGQRGCAASAGGFTVEFIHRDSARSPFHDPTLSPHERMLAAARRSLAPGGDADAPAPAAAGGTVSEIVSRSFEYLMSVKVGTPPKQLLAIADTGSDLVWVSCGNRSSDGGGGDYSAAASSSPPPPPRVVFDPSRSSTYGVVGCDTDACQALNQASCDGANCQYQYSYGDGSHTVGLLSTETFSFGVGAGAGALRLRVDKVKFGCSTHSAGTFRSDGLVGLGAGPLSLVSQLGAATRLGRRFSYCLVPFSSSAANASSPLNFGARAAVSEPGAASTPLVASAVPTYYTVELDAVSVGGKALATRTSPIVVDSGTTLTFLDAALLDPLVAELERRIMLPKAESPEQLLQLCYDVSGGRRRAAAAAGEGDDHWGIPDVTLQFGGGAAVTLRPENTFVMVQEGTVCLALVPVSEGQPTSILGNVAQQNFHVGYDLDAGTVTFAPADCSRSSAS